MARLTCPEPLIVAAQSGDVEAINALLTYCQLDLQRFAQTVCATPEDVEDAVQETLWIVSRKIGTLRTLSAFSGWLFQVVKYQCFRLLHEDQRQRALPSDDALMVDSVEREGIPREALSAAIAQLPRPYREVLIMRDLEERTAPQVAEQLGISVGAVKSRLRRARLTLRDALQAWM